MYHIYRIDTHQEVRVFLAISQSSGAGRRTVLVIGILGIWQLTAHAAWQGGRGDLGRRGLSIGGGDKLYIPHEL